VYLILFYSNFLSWSYRGSLLLIYCLNSLYSFLLVKITFFRPGWAPIFQVLLRPNSAHMELRGWTQLLDRFGCVQGPDRKGAMGKDRRKSRGNRFILRLLMSRGSNGGRSENLNSCSVKRVERTFSLKDPNWVSVPRRCTLTPEVPVRPCPGFRSWNLIQVIGERAKCNRGRTYNKYKERFFE